MGRLRMYLAVSYINLSQLDKAKEIINEDFVMSDIKEGELSVSALWKEIYGNRKPLPQSLDFRMHE